MAALEMSHQHHHHIDIENGSDGSCFSDAEEGSCYSQFYSTMGDGPYDDYSFTDHEMFINGVVEESSRRASSVSDCSVEVEIEDIIKEGHLAKVERDCRICHLGLESNIRESGVPIQLGCSCKDDLAAAHKLCAEAWFKIRGNKTCEICHSIARNVVGPNDVEYIEQPASESNNATMTAAVVAPVPHLETRRFWQGQRFLNFLLACMVFAFVISWLFHLNVPSS